MRAKSHVSAEMQDEDWRNLEHEIIQLFTPGTPINEAELLAGRPETVRQLENTVLEPGRHAAIYGERGVGKTSITNTFHRSLNKPTRSVIAIRVNGDSADTFETLWRKVFRRIKRIADDGTESWADQAHLGPLTSDDVVTELGGFGEKYFPIIVLDEFDRVTDTQCKTLMADIIKNLSDYTINCTIVLVGVAKSVSDLIFNLPSISRALVQVPMRRMYTHELNDIVTLRLTRLGMSIDEVALWRIIFFSAGLPFYTHSLGKYSALRAVAAKRKKITQTDVYDAMADCLTDVDQTIRESYTKATEKIYRKANIFAPVLAACALTEIDTLGRFTAVGVEGPLSEIMRQEMKSSSFGFHLNELSRPARGSILLKSGERRTYRFQFLDALMQPYIVMQSLRDGWITQEVLSKRELKPQKEFSGFSI